MSMIELKDIGKIYGKGDAKTEALKHINWTVEEGEFWSIVGPSGSGKTTLLNVLGCMDKPTSGEYLLGGKRVDTLSQKELSKIRNARLSFVFQQFALIHEYSVYDNIELPLLCRRMPHKKKKQLIHKYASYLGIEDLLKKKVTQISGGQQQRVAIARALVAETDLILADEPTGALDQNTGKELMQVLQDLNKQGKTIILVTHNPEIAEMTGKTLEICDGQCLVKA